jgi:hypothetical protein
MSSFARNLTAAGVAISLSSVSTVAMASAPPPAVPSPTNQWVALSAMTTSSTAVKSATAAQEESRDDSPPLPPLVVILATIATAVYILLRDDDGNLDLKLPVSPS